MKIKFVHSTPGIGYCWLANQEIEVDGKVLTKELAETFIEDGFAIKLEEDVVQTNEQDIPPAKPSRRKGAPKGNA